MGEAKASAATQAGTATSNPPLYKGGPGGVRTALERHAILVPILRSVIFLLTICGSQLFSAEPPPAETTPFELQPYRIRASIAFADSPSLDLELHKTILQELPATASRVLGEMWTVTAEENRWLLPASAEKLNALTAEVLPAELKSSSHDKSFLITVEESGGEFLISGREWDQVSLQLGNIEQQRIPLRRELPDAIFALARRVFRPLLAVDRTVSGVAGITVKAGALTPADPTASQLKAGQFWLPYLRYHKPNGDFDKLQTVPWTMLQVEEVNKENPAHGTARVVSGLRAALPSHKRSRVQVLARALEPVTTSTELRLVSRQNTNRPLVGVLVDARTKVDGPSHQYLTDRNGTVRIPQDPEHPLIWLYVRSGQKTLARLPVAPGLLPRVQAEIPDDSIRLRVEGELEILESNLTDTVAQRAVLMARIRKQIQLNDWKSVPEMTKDLRLLPGIDFYLKELTAIRVPAIQAAQAAKDKTAIAYIDRVCEETSKVIQKYLDDDKLRTFEEELKALQKQPPAAPKATVPKVPVPKVPVPKTPATT